MKEVIIYFKNGKKSTYYNVDNVSWSGKIIYLDIYNEMIDADETVCIEREQVGYIMLKC